jgi:hypothetical protein
MHYLIIMISIFAYGIAITTASGFDTFTAPTLTSKCLSEAGFVCGTAGTISTGFSIFNNTIGLPVFGVLGETIGGACFWLGRRANKTANLIG